MKDVILALSKRRAFSMALVTSQARMVSGKGAQTRQTTMGGHIVGAKDSGIGRGRGRLTTSKLALSSLRKNGGGRKVARVQASREERETEREENEQNKSFVAEVVQGKIERRNVLAGLAGASLLAKTEGAQAGLFGGKKNKNLISSEWEIVNLPLDPENPVVLLDIAFVPGNPQRGYLLGTRQTILETTDGGKTWTKKELAAAQDEGFNYRFNSISFSGNEGWIVGKPPILLHSTNAGESWERVPLNAKLPGTPVLVTGTGEGAAEMTTDVGAIYVTSNAGLLWKAAVQETVDATLNRTVSSGISGASFYTGQFSSVKRNSEGKYVAVSSRGNFYMTWEPGQTYWQPHNRASPRRLQDMGWRPKGGLWLATRGGDLYFNDDATDLDAFDQINFGARGFGILDVGFQPGINEDGSEGTLWACGGSGTLYKSADQGKKWKRVKGGDKLPGNLYAVKFVTEKQGFILGNAGILLRYVGGENTA